MTHWEKSPEYFGRELRRPASRSPHLEHFSRPTRELWRGLMCGQTPDCIAWKRWRPIRKHGCRFVLSARGASPGGELKALRWTGSPRTDAAGQCDFRCRTEGWAEAHRFAAFRATKSSPSQGSGTNQIHTGGSTRGNTAVAHSSPTSNLTSQRRGRGVYQQRAEPD